MSQHVLLMYYRFVKLQQNSPNRWLKVWSWPNSSETKNLNANLVFLFWSLNWVFVLEFEQGFCLIKVLFSLPISSGTVDNVVPIINAKGEFVGLFWCFLYTIHVQRSIFCVVPFCIRVNLILHCTSTCLCAFMNRHPSSRQPQMFCKSVLL